MKQDTGNAHLRNIFSSGTLPLVGTFAVGLVPALILLTTMRLDEGQLILLQANLGPYTLNQLLAGLIATANPLLLLAPLAWFIADPNAFRKWRLLPLLFPFALFGPSVLAGLVIGGSFWYGQVLVLAGMALALPAFTLWLEGLATLLGKTSAVLCYGMLWGFSSFLNYLDQYVLAYLEGRLDWARHIIWLVPPIGSLADQCGLFLIEAQFDGRFGAILLGQSLLLGGLLLWQHKRDQKK